MDERVKPCPWCGEYPKIAEDGGSAGPWFCVWHDCPPVEGGKARHYGESLGCISISTAWFHTEAEAIAAWNTRAELGSEREKQLEELVRDAYWLIARAVWTHVSQDKFAADWTERMSVLGIEVD